MLKFMKKHSAALTVGVIASLVSIALFSLVEYASGQTLGSAERNLVLAVIIFFIIVGGAIFFEEVIKRYLRPQVEQEVRTKLEKEFEKHREETISSAIETAKRSLDSRLERDLGIVDIFPNFDSCETEILNEIETSKEVKVFLQMGKTILSGATNFYDYLSILKTE